MEETSLGVLRHIRLTRAFILHQLPAANEDSISDRASLAGAPPTSEELNRLAAACAPFVESLSPLQFRMLQEYIASAPKGIAWALSLEFVVSATNVDTPRT